jgi:hypothetical protein
MKKTIIALSMLTGLLSTTSFAALSGAYVGGGIGYGDIYRPNIDVTSTAGGHGGLAGRMFAGIQYTPYVGLELGYTKFANTTLRETDTVAPIGIFTGTSTVQSYAADAVVTGTIPLQNGFSVKGKLGGAYLNEKSNAHLATANGASTEHISGIDSKLLPTFGLGAGYDINQSVSTEVSWMHIQKMGGTDLQSTNLMTAGLTYHFG